MGADTAGRMRLPCARRQVVSQRGNFSDDRRTQRAERSARANSWLASWAVIVIGLSIKLAGLFQIRLGIGIMMVAVARGNQHRIHLILNASGVSAKRVTAPYPSSADWPARHIHTPTSVMPVKSASSRIRIKRISVQFSVPKSLLVGSFLLQPCRPDFWIS